MGYSQWGQKESDTAEYLTLSLSWAPRDGVDTQGFLVPVIRFRGIAACGSMA